MWVFFFFRANRSMLSYEETNFLRVYKAMEQLDTYFEDKNDSCRKAAARNVNIVMSDIQSWKGGSLRVYRNELGPHLEAFKKAFYQKLVGALRQYEKPDLERAFDILKEFAYFLTDENAKIADLDRLTEKINREISVMLPPRNPLKLTLTSLREYHYLNDILACVASIGIGAIIGIIGKYAFSVPNEYTYPLAVTAALGVAVIYFAYLRKGQK